MKRVLSVCILIIMVSVFHMAESGPEAQTTKRAVRQSPEFLKAQELEAQKKYGEAKELYKFLYESEGSDITFWKLLLLCEKTEDFKGIERLAHQRLEKYPDDISAMRYLARAYYGQGNKKKGRRTLLNIIGKRWNDTGRIYLAASEFVNQNDLDSAIDIYTTARERIEKHDLFASQLARIYSIRMEYIKALEEYITMLDKVEISYSNVEKMIQKALEAGKKPYDIALPLARYLKHHPESIKAARLLSNLKYDDGDFDGARMVLVTTAVASDNPQDVWNLAERFKKDGHIDEALVVFADYYRFFENDPRRVFSLLESASIKATRGDIEGALQDYRNLAKGYRGTQEGDTATLRIIQLAQDAEDIEGFTQSLCDFASTTRFRTVAREAYIVLGETFLREGHPEESKQAFQQAQIKSRTKKELYGVAVHAALLNFFTGDFDAMSQDIETCVMNNQSGEEVNDLLSFKVLGMMCTSEAELRDFAAYAGGQYALYRGEINAAVDSFLVAAQDTSSIVAPYAAQELAQVYNLQGDAEKAVTWYLHAATTAHDVTVLTGALMEAADILAVKLDDKERAKSMYREALTRYPGSVHESEIRRKLMRVTEE